MFYFLNTSIEYPTERGISDVAWDFRLRESLRPARIFSCASSTLSASEILDGLDERGFVKLLDNSKAYKVSFTYRSLEIYTTWYAANFPFSESPSSLITRKSMLRITLCGLSIAFFCVFQELHEEKYYKTRYILTKVGSYKCTVAKYLLRVPEPGFREPFK